MDCPPSSGPLQSVLAGLRHSVERARRAGIPGNRIVLDPGLGFGKGVEDNLLILRRLEVLKRFQLPILVGPSRKSFIGNLLNLPVEQRLPGSLASTAVAVTRGAHIVRVHDVRETRQVVQMCDAIMGFSSWPAMNLIELFRLDRLTWSSAVDILIVSILIYHILLLIRGTRAVQMALGVGFLVLFYYVTLWFNLETVQWIMTTILPFFVVGIIVLFAAEIRRALANIGKNPLLRRFSRNPIAETYEEIVSASMRLSTQRVGALIVIEREMGLKDYTESGVAVDAALSSDLLVSLFLPGAPLHDGAVIVQKGRITTAACFLPLTLDPRLSKELGDPPSGSHRRHRRVGRRGGGGLRRDWKHFHRSGRRHPEKPGRPLPCAGIWPTSLPVPLRRPRGPHPTSLRWRKANEPILEAPHRSSAQQRRVEARLAGPCPAAVGRAERRVPLCR